MERSSGLSKVTEFNIESELQCALTEHKVLFLKLVLGLVVKVQDGIVGKDVGMDGELRSGQQDAQGHSCRISANTLRNNHPVQV